MSKEKTTAWVRLATTKAGRIGLVASERGLVLSTLPGRVVTAGSDGNGGGSGGGNGGGDGGSAVTLIGQRPSGPGRKAPSHPVRDSKPPSDVAAILGAAEDGLVSYYREWPTSPGERVGKLWDTLLELQVDLEGLPAFTRNVLELLRQVRPGTVVTYGELAARAGSPRAARAVGSVMARNPLPIILPCHRVVASDGTLGGFAGDTRGEAVVFKEQLLRYEGWRQNASGASG